MGRLGQTVPPGLPARNGRGHRIPPTDVNSRDNKIRCTESATAAPTPWRCGVGSMARVSIRGPSWVATGYIDRNP